MSTDDSQNTTTWSAHPIEVVLAGPAKRLAKLHAESAAKARRCQSRGERPSALVAALTRAAPEGACWRVRVEGAGAERVAHKLCVAATRWGLSANAERPGVDAHALLEVPLRFYRATSEHVTAVLRTNAEGVLWLADSPAVAQAYIPEAGMTVAYGIRENAPVVPGNEWTDELARQLGYQARVFATDSLGRPQSWRWDRGEEHGVSVKGAEIVELLEQRLGYVPHSTVFERQYQLKGTFTDGRPTVLPAAYYRQGRVHVLEATAGLRLFDWSSGREGDLISPDYNNPQLADRARREGYDGMVIHDFCQTETWGSVGHVSYAIFESALDKLAVVGSYPATHFDWADERGLRETDTAEHRAWLAWCEATCACPTAPTRDIKAPCP